LDNLFSIQIKFNNEKSINNTTFLDPDNQNNQYFIKLKTVRNFLKSMNFKHKKSMDSYLFFDNSESKLITRVEYFDENGFIIMENSLCNFIELDDNAFDININEIWTADLSAVYLLNHLWFARENFLKDNGSEGCNFNFLISHKEKNNYNQILKIRFYKSNEKKDMTIEVPFYERRRKSNKNNINKNNLEIDVEFNEEEEFNKNVICLEEFQNKNFHKIFYDTKHILNFLNCFSFFESKFVLNLLESKGLKIDIEIELGFNICYVFPNKGEQV